MHHLKKKPKKTPSVDDAYLDRVVMHPTCTFEYLNLNCPQKIQDRTSAKVTLVQTQLYLTFSYIALSLCRKVGGIHVGHTIVYGRRWAN